MLVSSMGRKHQLFLILDEESFDVTYFEDKYSEKKVLGRLGKSHYKRII